MSAELRTSDSEYVRTNLGNKISRNAKVKGGQAIMVAGNTIFHDDVIIRGDICSVQVGNYCVVGPRTVVRPSYKQLSTGLTYFPVRIGNRVVIEPDCVINAAEIGNHVYIGRDVVVGQSCVIKDCCFITEGSVLSPDTVIAPFSIVSGNPARIVGTLPVNTPQLMIELTDEIYYKFQPTLSNAGR